MDIKKRSRTELKSYFIKNAIPTANNFADLIEAQINQLDDGVVKAAGSPLSVQAAGDDTSLKEALSLYSSFADPSPSWTLRLRPRVELGEAATARTGLAISDAQGKDRLFIKQEDGFVGVGTVEPTHALHVKGSGAVGLFESTAGQAYLRLAANDGLANRVEVCNRGGGRLALRTAAGDAVSVLRDGNVGVRQDSPRRALHVGDSGQLQLAPANSVSADSEAGIYWHSDDNYRIARERGPWSAPDYQQLQIRFATGITLEPGTGDNAGHGRSFVEIRRGKGLRVSQGTVGIGPGEPGAARMRVASSAADYLHVQPQDGAGELRLIGWGKGWNINAQTNGKHLYINRGSGDQSNLYLGRQGKELVVLGNGNVGVGMTPTVSFEVKGNIQCNRIDTAAGFAINGQRNNHIEVDGALYRKGGQVFLTVDDSLYVRDSGGGKVFHFDTNKGALSLDGLSAEGDITVKGTTLTQQLKVMTQSFKVGGNANTFYPIIWDDQGWGDGPLEIEITRANVHLDGEWKGSLVAWFRVHSTNWGHGSHFCRCEIHSFRRRFVAWYTCAPQSGHAIIWLRGAHTYHWRSNHPAAVTDSAAKTGKKVGGATFNTRTGVDSALNQDDVWEHHHKP